MPRCHRQATRSSSNRLSELKNRASDNRNQVFDKISSLRNKFFGIMRIEPTTPMSMHMKIYDHTSIPLGHEAL